jgi:methionine-rich copper-binding protein CopC
VRAEKKTARRAIEALVAQVQAEDEKDAHEERKSQHKAWRAEGEDNDEDDVEWETSAQFPSDDVSNNDSDEPMTVRLSEEVLGKLALSLDESGDLDSAVFTVEASADGASPQQSLPFSELMARFSRLKASAPTSPTSDNTREVMKRQRPRASLRFLNAQGESVGFGWARDTATQRLVEVSASGQAAAAGVQVGWRVVAVDGKAVHDNDSFEAAVTSARAKGNNSVDFEFEVPRVVSDVEAVARQKAASDAARDTGFVAAAMLEEASQPGNMERSSGSRDQWETPSYGVESSSKSVPLSKSKQSEAAPPSLSSRTLEALRILTASGQLTGAEKAKLMTSMVQAKAANAGYEDNGSRVPSLVEVGFEVLVDGTSDGGGTYTEGMADFASYCRSIIDA